MFSGVIESGLAQMESAGASGDCGDAEIFPEFFNPVDPEDLTPSTDSCHSLIVSPSAVKDTTEFQSKGKRKSKLWSFTDVKKYCREQPAITSSSSSSDFSDDELRSASSRASLYDCDSLEDFSPSPRIHDWVTTFMDFNLIDKTAAITQLAAHCDSTLVRHLKSIIEPHFQRDFISLLPKELSLYILSFLEPTDLLKVALTCRYWKTVAEDNLLWREICEEAAISLDASSHAQGFQTLNNNSSCSSSGSSPGKAIGCYRRSPWKSVFMRHRRIDLNWRSNPIKKPKILRGHDEHVITCLLFHGDKIISGSDDNSLKVWSFDTGKCLKNMTGHTGGVWSCQVTDDGQLVVSGSTDRTVKVWDMTTGNCLRTLNGHISTVRCMALKGDIAVSGSRDTTLRAWNVRTGECLHILTGHLCAIRCVQFDGRRAVSGAYDYTVKVWDVEEEVCLCTLTGHNNRVYSLEFDPLRDIVVSGSLDTTIRVWNIRTGECVHTLVGHRSLNSEMQLRGNILISGNADSTIKIWDISTGKCLHTLAGPNKHNSAVTCLQFLNNGLVATSSDDGTVKLWDVESGQFIRDIFRLETSGSGGVVWRLKATSTVLVCAVGSRNGVEDTKLLMLDFNAEYP